MQKQEILNDDFVENEVVQPKNNKKIKIAIAIATSISIVATTIILVGYFKFYWFKGEIYNVDAKISRNLYSANYYSQTKSIKTRTGFNSGVSEEKEYFIYTNFMVMDTERKELDNNDFLNTATLVILDTRVNMDNQFKEVNSFNIFEQSTIEEFKANPDGSKYPMAIFSYYENGTIADIQLPNNMDSYNAKSIIQLIDDIIPKLARNRKEDISNGLSIETRKNKSKRTLVETQAPKEVDKFKGSRFEKSIEREIDNEKLTKIKSNANMSLKTEKEEDEATFGLKDFYIDQKTEIISTGENKDKEKAELLKELAEKYTFIKSKDLLEMLEKNNKKEEKEQVIEEWVENESQIRKLGFNIANSYTKTIKTFNVLGAKVEVKIKCGVSNGKAYCQLIVGSATIGPDGLTVEYDKKWQTPELTVFYFMAPPPVSFLQFRLSLQGQAKVSIKFALNSKVQLNFSLSGDFYACAKVVAGIENFLSFEAGAKGTIISANASFQMTNTKVTKSLTFSGGKISAFVQGYLIGYKWLDESWTVFEGWKF